MAYRILDGAGHEVDTIAADSVSSALSAAEVGLVAEVDLRHEPLVERLVAVGPDGRVAGHRWVTRDQDEPPCSGGEDHDWAARSPWWRGDRIEHRRRCRRCAVTEVVGPVVHPACGDVAPRDVTYYVR